MKKTYVVRPIEILTNLEEIDEWEYPNQDMELFPYDVVYQTLEEYNKTTDINNRSI